MKKGKVNFWLFVG